METRQVKPIQLKDINRMKCERDSSIQKCKQTNIKDTMSHHHRNKEF